MKSWFLSSQQKKNKHKSKMVMGSNLVSVLLCFCLVAALASMVYASEVSVEGVKMENQFGVWVIVGRVRNLEKHPIRGFVKIKFLDANGNIVKSVNAFVTSQDSLAPSQAATFELWTNFTGSTGELDFDIDFVERMSLNGTEGGGIQGTVVASVQEVMNSAPKNDNVKQKNVSKGNNDVGGSIARSRKRGFVIQVGAFRSVARAEKLQKTLQDKGYDAYLEKHALSDDGLIHRVRIRGYMNLDDAREEMERLYEEEGLDSFALPMVQNLQ